MIFSQQSTAPVAGRQGLHAGQGGPTEGAAPEGAAAEGVRAARVAREVGVPLLALEGVGGQRGGPSVEVGLHGGEGALAGQPAH